MTAAKATATLDGVIRTYDPVSCQGSVLIDGHVLGFHVSSWWTQHRRKPEPGNLVEVVVYKDPDGIPRRLLELRPR